MRLSNCYHPSLVFNKYIGEYVIARCGKCPACLDARCAQWVQRLEMEIESHPYTFFVTFQYDEYNVNQFIRLRKDDNPNSLPSYIDSSTGQIISLSDLPSEIVSPADIQYCNETKVLLVHNVSDHQKFIKRLRKYIVKNYGTNFRYYSAFEYGPQTYRPHIHSLFFLDSSLLAKDFGELLSANWKHGCTFDPHPCPSSAASYVAAYVNSNVYLPSIYLHSNIKQKAVFSKRPPIGFTSFSEKSYKRLFDSSAISETIYRQAFHQFCDVPLWRTIQSKLYPRIPQFAFLSHFDRIQLYRMGERLAFRSKDYDKVIDSLTIPYWSEYFEIAFKTLRDGYYFFNQDSLSRFVSMVVRVCDNAKQFGVSVDYYVTKIETFYDKKQKSNLREFYELQDEYFKTHPLSDVMVIYPNLFILTKGKRYDSLKPWLKYYVDLYLPNHKEVIEIKYSDAFCYRETRGLHDKIFHENVKVKKSNDYLLSHKDKFSNIINYNKNIKNYE